VLGAHLEGEALAQISHAVRLAVDVQEPTHCQGVRLIDTGHDNARTIDDGYGALHAHERHRVRCGGQGRRARAGGGGVKSCRQDQCIWGRTCACCSPEVATPPPKPPPEPSPAMPCTSMIVTFGAVAAFFSAASVAERRVSKHRWYVSRPARQADRTYPAWRTARTTSGSACRSWS
jgi:hypothetical protein